MTTKTKEFPRLYGRKGFTETKKVETIIGPHVKKVQRKLRLLDLPAADAVKLAGLLPEGQTDNRANDTAPTFGEIVKLAEAFDGAVCGIVVKSDSPNERISLDSITIPSSKVHTKAAYERVSKTATKTGASSVLWIFDAAINEPRLVITWGGPL